MLSALELKALKAVNDGKCWRRYHTSGNAMHGDGVSAQILRRLESYGLIGDRRAAAFQCRGCR